MNATPEQTQIEALQVDYQELMIQHQALQIKYEKLRIEHQALQDDNQSLYQQTLAEKPNSKA